MRDAYDYWGAACGTDATGWGGCNGNGDNEIEYWHEETLKMWQHMALVGVVEGSYNGLVMLFDAVNPTDGLVSGSGSSNSALIPAEAKRIDAKMDDGLPYSGKVVQHTSVKSGCFGNWVNNWMLDVKTTECEIRWLIE